MKLLFKIKKQIYLQAISLYQLRLIMFELLGDLLLLYILFPLGYVLIDANILPQLLITVLFAPYKR